MIFEGVFKDGGEDYKVTWEDLPADYRRIPLFHKDDGKHNILQYVIFRDLGAEFDSPL